MHDGTTTYCGEENKLKLAGSSGRETTIAEADCYIKINNRTDEQTIHVVPADFQLHVL